MHLPRPVVALGLALVTLLTPLCRPGLAAADPVGLIADLGKEALSMLGDQKLSPAERQQRFHALVDGTFDFPRITRFVLGRYWQVASDAEKQQFAKVFEDYMVQTYTARFSEYSGEAMKVTGQRAESDNVTLVHSDILRPNAAEPVKVDWRVAKSGNDYRITDVSIAGASMALAQREEFAAIMQRNGGQVSGLIEQLRAKLGAPPPAK